MPLPPIAAGFIIEFFRTVFSELAAALKRRRAKRALDSQKKAEKESNAKEAAEQRAVYQECLKDLKKGSKIPENPYK
jgi:high-affinity K+ transport system ATPase subunit B